MFGCFGKNKKKSKTAPSSDREEYTIAAMGSHAHDFFINTNLMKELSSMELDTREYTLKTESEHIRIQFSNMIGVEGFNSLRDKHLKDSQIILVFSRNDEEAKDAVNISKQHTPSGSIFLVILEDKKCSNDNKDYTIFDEKVRHPITSFQVSTLAEFFELIWDTYQDLKNLSSNNSHGIRK